MSVPPVFNPTKSFRVAPKLAVQPVEEVDDEVARVLDGEFDPPPRAFVPQPVFRSPEEALDGMRKTRKENLAEQNKHWNREQVPQKWLVFYDLSDLEPFGIKDAQSDPRRLFVDLHELNRDGSPFGMSNPMFPNRVCNPLYIEGYLAWKAKRFPHGLPARDSTWRLRYETRDFVDASPALLKVCPRELPCGEELREREHFSKEVHMWEEPYCRELYFEILLTSQRFEARDFLGRDITPQRETKNEFIVMSETE